MTSTTKRVLVMMIGLAALLPCTGCNIIAPIYYFAANHHDDLKAMFGRLTDWIFQ